ncbi:MAG: FG-GAP-like repeat-containing protein [Planctomycetes bacterium]|nr:FG-GAP-like repeat-containing protein [Planctomycetota bacterium]
MAGGGDADADGVPDVIVGARFHDAGGLDAGRAEVRSGATGAILWQWDGSAPYDYLGASVAVAGDLDADGFADLLVGVPGSDASSWDAGRAVVFSGASAAPLFTWSGVATDDAFGFAVAGAGDGDGDGIPDAIVGAPLSDQTSFNAGQARVFSGATGSLRFDLFGSAPWGQFGFSVAGAGKVDGDGYGDFAVGSFVGSPGARVYSGATGAPIFAWPPLSPPTYAPGLGRSLAPAGDVDGDGHDDLIVGAPGYSSSGTALVFSGGTGTVLLDLYSSPAQTGFSVAGPGDLDGDGTPDVLVGAPGEVTASPYAPAGAVRAHSGASGATLFTWSGSTPNANFARTVAGVGDLDGDGSDDVVVGIPGPQSTGTARVYSGASGATLLTVGAGAAVAGVGDVDGDGTPDVAGSLIGQTAGQVRVYSGSTGVVLLVVNPPGPSLQQFGAAISGTGDVDGDGHADLLVGAPQASGGGHAWAFSGAGGSVLLEWSEPEPEANFGFSVAGVGDADGDGLPDMAIGAPNAGGSGTPDSGRATLFSGADGGVLHTWNGFLPGGHLGWSVAGAGLVDSDGDADVVVGGPDYSSGALGGGVVRVFSGGTGGVLHAWFGNTPYERFGYAVAGGVDVDGDGFDDLLAGAPYHDGAGTDAGRVAVFSGSSGVVLDAISGSFPMSRLGWSVARVGRVDVGACGEFLAGTPYDQTTGQGAAYLYASSAGGPQGYVDLAGGVAGAIAFPPLLRGFGVLAPGGAVTLAAYRLAAGAPGVLVLGFSRIDLPILSGVLAPYPDFLVPYPSGPSGSASLDLALPPVLPSAGIAIYAQAVFLEAVGPSGISMANGLSVTLP